MNEFDGLPMEVVEKLVQHLDPDEVMRFGGDGTPSGKQPSEKRARALARIQRLGRHLAQFKDKMAYEENVWRQGFKLVAGVDEAGRGPLAGPVVAASVILPIGTFIEGLDDSKRLSPGRREALYIIIRRIAVSIGVGCCSSQHVDEHNIHKSSLEAMKMAVWAMVPRPDYVLVDGFSVPSLGIVQQPITRGDSLSNSIAAASIIAKVTRDRIMNYLDEMYPGYGFSRNKGYATLDHVNALRRLGPSPVHRKSFDWSNCYTDEL